MSCVSERDTQKCKKELLILNLNNFFLSTLKKLNGQKLDHLFIFLLLKFGGN